MWKSFKERERERERGGEEEDGERVRKCERVSERDECKIQEGVFGGISLSASIRTM